MQAEIGDLFEMTNAEPTKIAVQSAVSGFDYAALPTEHVDGTRECAAWVRDTLGKLEAHTIETMTVVGVRLNEAKEAIGHGGFMKWVEAECGLSQKTANRSMDLAKTFGLDQIRHVTNLPQRLVYEVAASSTPETIRDEVKAKIAAGQPIERKELEVQIARAKTDVLVFKAHSRGGKPATAKNIAAYQKRADATARRNRLAYLDEMDVASKQKGQRLEDARKVVGKIMSFAPSPEIDAIKTDVRSRGTSGKLEMLTQALREALLPGARDEWEVNESRWMADRERERQQLLSSK